MDERGGNGFDRSKTSNTDQWMHRQAIQLVAQLPDDTAAALAVLDRARELLVCWDALAPPQATPVRPVLVKG